jgi:hypothetical protein
MEVVTIYNPSDNFQLSTQWQFNALHYVTLALIMTADDSSILLDRESMRIRRTIIA